MELVHLRTFLAVVEHRGVRRAARRLYLSEPAVSRQLAALERSVGVPLLIRTPSGAEPTPAGLVLAERAQRLLDDSRAAVSAARDEALAGDLVVAVTPGGVAELTGPLLRHLARAFPRVRLRTREASLLDWPDPESPGIDLVVVRDPFPHDRLRSTLLVSDPMVLGVPLVFPEAAATRLSVDEALGVPFARINRRVDRSVEHFWTLRDHHGAADLRFEGRPSSGPAEVGQAVGRGVGVAFTTGMVVRQFQPGPRRLALVPVDGAPAVRVAMVSARDDHRPLIDAVHREVAWVARRLGPLVLPELAATTS